MRFHPSRASSYPCRSASVRRRPGTGGGRRPRRGRGGAGRWWGVRRCRRSSCGQRTGTPAGPGCPPDVVRLWSADGRAFPDLGWPGDRRPRRPARVDDGPLVLERKAREVLTLLALHAPAALPVDELARVLWEEPPASATKTVRAHLSRIRTALREGGVTDAIATVGNSAYRLVADTDVQLVAGAAAAGPARGRCRPRRAPRTSWPEPANAWTGDPELPGHLARPGVPDGLGAGASPAGPGAPGGAGHGSTPRGRARGSPRSRPPTLWTNRPGSPSSSPSTGRSARPRRSTP